jgi:hypothetical protein
MVVTLKLINILKKVLYSQRLTIFIIECNAYSLEKIGVSMEKPLSLLNLIDLNNFFPISSFFQQEDYNREALNPKLRPISFSDLIALDTLPNLNGKHRYTHNSKALKEA